MFIDKFTNNGKPYLRITQAVRRPNKHGVMVSCKKVIKNLGPLDRYDDGAPNFLERLRASFKAGNPIIPELKEYVSVATTPSASYSFTIRQGSLDCIGHPRLYAQILLERILEELGLNTLAASIKRSSKIQYDFYGFLKLLVFGRLLHPASKCATMKQNENYYSPILKEFNSDNVYDTLSLVYEHRRSLIRRMNYNLVKKAGRSSKLVYYDVTNFYFEIEDPDEDVLGEDGTTKVKGLRQMGVSKENRRQPIVQMGMFMDESGIPITIKAFPGNTLDHLTLGEILSQDIKYLGLSRFIMVADRGICCYPNLLQLTSIGHGYIVSKSLAKTSRQERDWAYDETGYIQVGKDFKYKSRIVKRIVLDRDHVKHTIEEQVVVYFSKRFQRRAEHKNRKFLAFLDKLEKHPYSFRVSASESRPLRKFFKRDYLNVQTGELVDSAKLRGMIDFEKVKEYRKELGYYQIVTSELEMDPQEVIKQYHGLTQIEDQFRVMKSVLDTRPIYLQTREHIEAHLLICTIALVVLRIIQKRITNSGKLPLDPAAHWTNGLNPGRIQDALNKWQVDCLPNGLYRFMDLDDPDLKLILDAFQIKIPTKLYNKTELKELKSSIKIFM